MDGDWFDWEDSLPEYEQEFLQELRRFALGWQQLGVEWGHTGVFRPDGVLACVVDVSDRVRILDAHRIDLHRGYVLLSSDGTDQFVRPLSEGGGAERRSAADASTLAHASAEWVECQLRRRIERHEWTVDGGRHKRWCYVDSDLDLFVEGPGYREVSRSELGPEFERSVVRDFSLKKE